MKKILSLVFVFICVLSLFTGCKKKENIQVFTTAPTTIHIENKNESVSTYDEATRTLKRVDYNPDGSIAMITEITKNEKGLPIKECVYDSEEKLISVSTIEYDEKSNVIKQSFYNENNELITVQKHIYDDKGQHIAVETYSAEGNLIAKNEF